MFLMGNLQISRALIFFVDIRKDAILTQMRASQFGLFSSTVINK